MKEKLVGKNDIIMIGVLVLCGAIITLALLLTRHEGSQVVVSVDGKEIASFPLDKDITYEIDGYEGGHNTLIIKDGAAYMSDASCPDHLCMGMGKISKNGQSIICLPNRVVVEIRDAGGKAPEYDVVG